MAAPTFDELVQAFIAEAQDRRPDLTFDEGDITEMDAYGGAAMADYIVGWAALRIKATYFDGARGDDLTTLADDHFSIQRRLAISAVGEVTFGRVSAAAGAGTIPIGTIVATQKDNLGREIQYQTDYAVNWGAIETGNKTVSVTASLTGIGTNTAAATVDRIVSSLFDTTFTVTNALSMAGGSEAETDDQLLERVRTFADTIRRATLAAIEYGAKQGTGAALATALEDSTGIVNLYVSDQAGESNVVMIAAVDTEMRNWRAAGIVVNVFGGSIYNISIALALTARLGVSTPALVAKVRDAVVAKVNKLKIGETLNHDQIRDAAMGVDPDGITKVTVTDPSVDLEPLPTQLIRTSAGSVTVT